MLTKRGSYNFVYFLLAVWALTSCNTSKYLGTDEFLLQKNIIKLKKKQQLDNKRTVLYELSTLLKQRPNGNFLWIPREWFFYNTSSREDPSKFLRWQKRVLGEKPVIYDPEAAQATAEAMETYLEYIGHFNAEVLPNPYVKNNKMYVEYIVDAKKQLTIDTVLVSSKDTAILNLLQKVDENTYLQEDEGLEGKRYELEKERISRYLRNNGYAYFYSNFITQLRADSTVVPGKAQVQMQILPPPKKEAHTQYRIGTIEVYPNFSPEQLEKKLPAIEENGIIIYGEKDSLEVRPQAIRDAIALKKGELYREIDFNQTNKRLSGLGVFRFVRIKYTPDTLQTGLLNFRIELTPNPKLEVGIDFELNYTNRSTSSATADLLGVSISPSIRNRNLLNGAELLISDLSLGVEVNPSSGSARFWNTIDINFRNELYIPKFLDYLGIWRGLNRFKTGTDTRIVGDGFLQTLENKATSRVQASYNFLLLLDFYRYNFFNASFGYDVPKSNTERYFINHLAIDYLSPETEPDFDTILLSNPFLDRSFGQQLFVSMLFRDLTYTKRTLPNEKGVSRFFGANFEVAGLEIWAGNSLYNTLASRNDTLSVGAIDFSQYVKMELDFRRYKKISPKSTLAARFNIGIAQPFGFTSDVPYVKQFFVGGPNSIRAWAARGLGPGGHIDSLTFNSNNRLLFYQTGDLKLEFNLEYRFDIYWRLKGAVFLDGGNVWTISEDPDRCGSQFLFSPKNKSECPDSQPGAGDPFYRQIALGTGFGLRFDFKYFIFRIDLGLQLRNPFPIVSDPDNITEADYWTNFSNYQFSDINFNLGLGYPF